MCLAPLQMVAACEQLRFATETRKRGPPVVSKARLASETTCALGHALLTGEQSLKAWTGLPLRRDHGNVYINGAFQNEITDFGPPWRGRVISGWGMPKGMPKGMPHQVPPQGSPPLGLPQGSRY